MLVPVQGPVKKNMKSPFNYFYRFKARFLRTYAMLLMILAAMPAQSQWHFFESTAMTTRVALEFWMEDAEQAQRIKRQALKIFYQVDERMSAYRRQSELSKLNRSAFDAPVPLSPELFEVLKKSLEISELSEGAFDITFGSVGFLYDYRTRIKPESTNLKKALESVDYRALVLDDKARTLSFSKPGMNLGLGGIAKGYSVDQVIELLKAHGVAHAQVSAGGDLRLLGDKRGRPWVVGVRDPRSNKHTVALPLEDAAISTSGDYERYFIDDNGQRIHHILSPKTGQSVQGIQSVTIIGPTAMETDGLSTAVFVLGVEDGLGLINKLEAFDAIIIDEQRRMHYSEGLMSPQ